MTNIKPSEGFKAAPLDDFLVRDYLIKILGDGEELAQEFYSRVLEKSNLFKDTFSKDKLASLDKNSLAEIFYKTYPARRFRNKIIEETGLNNLKNAISDLLYTKADSWEQRVNAFADVIRGVSRKNAKDIAAEILHFTFPEDYILYTSWIWDPESESGAIVFLKEEAPVNGHGREMYGSTYEEFYQTYVQVYEKLIDFGIRVRGFLFVDIFLAMIYGTYVDYMSLSTMHSAKGFFPPADFIAKRLLGVLRDDEVTFTY